MSVAEEPLRVAVGKSTGEVSAVLQRPPDAFALVVLAHGAGADMHHRFMVEIAGALVERRVAVLRYQFPYTERGHKRPDPPARLHATVRAVVAEGLRRAEGLPVLAGGKSMGGRMTSQAAAAGELPGVRGVVFLGFPLHPAKEPSTTRAAHLAEVSVPMLFLQGTRDPLAPLPSITEVVRGLGSRAHLHVVEDADHSFAVRKTRGHDPAAVIPGLADAMVSWLAAMGSGATAGNGHGR
ncbi:alpha/beta hydrolase family protein [Paraliomyxa miuraensis]|uniref:alpha/beta hydrolase family protein n=1 Tax=Paraliomyxa miuraensis TaxID=376150 RepID=UPI002258F373|nr:alpha/beta family hydrolase [Paraliomyxa miuraensis]MCX4241102.1 dienelactone hydrolase family protein [Paraliomyxa miuraensis]